MYVQTKFVQEIHEEI